jgi:hypothetical protein
MRWSTWIIVMTLVACRARVDRKEACRELVEHVRKVSQMPMRDGDVSMMMGACEMWKQSTIDCIRAARHDDDIKRCRDMEP